MAGCVGSNSDNGGDSDIKDSDGDGVIDSEDYAPQDAEVQEKSDLDSTTTPTVGTKTTTTPPTTTTTTTTTTRTTTTPTTTETPANTLKVTDSYWEEESFITEYSSEEVSVKVRLESSLTTRISSFLLL